MLGQPTRQDEAGAGLDLAGGRYLALGVGAHKRQSAQCLPSLESGIYARGSTKIIYQLKRFASDSLKLNVALLTALTVDYRS